MKKKFIETPACKLKLHCHACVFNEMGIREQWMQVFEWDGKCPNGYTDKNIDDYPSVFEQAKNAAIAAAKIGQAISRGERIKATKRVQNNRKKICASCDRLNKEDNRCIECGCYYDVKIALATEECPIGKWKKSRNLKKTK